MNEKTMNMNLEEFTERVAESVRKKMPQMEIKTVQQKKNNGVSKLGICMEKKKAKMVGVLIQSYIWMIFTVRFRKWNKLKWLQIK